MLAGAHKSRRLKSRGFTMVELLVAVSVICVVAAMSYPYMLTMVKTYRVAGDAKRIAAQIALARMRSAGDFNQAQVSIDTTAKTFRMNICDKPTGTFITNESGTLPLSTGVSYGFGSITTPANPSQATIAQTAPVTFNSRGVPITLATTSCTSAATVTNSNAIYLSGGGNLYYAVTVNLTGKIDIWRYSGSAWRKVGY